jgi:uncharacterized glyoxalase superfamily protein PhnB
MKLAKLTPMLWVKDLDASVRFYVDVLGFACVNHVENWAALQRDDIEIMLSLPNEHSTIDRILFSGSFYFRVEDVDEWWENLKGKTKVVYPIENFFYGMREFAIEDNNGYCLQFGQEIEDSAQIPASDQA